MQRYYFMYTYGLVLAVCKHAFIILYLYESTSGSVKTAIKFCPFPMDAKKALIRVFPRWPDRTESTLS